MKTTIWSLKPNNNMSTKNQDKKVLLTKSVKTLVNEKITYLDLDGIVKDTSEYEKTSNGDLVVRKQIIEKYPIYTSYSYNYTDEDVYFSYLDSKGIKRTFTKMDSLEYNEETNTYTGLVEEIVYDTIDVELFEEEK